MKGSRLGRAQTELGNAFALAALLPKGESPAEAFEYLPAQGDGSLDVQGLWVPCGRIDPGAFHPPAGEPGWV